MSGFIEIYIKLSIPRPTGLLIFVDLHLQFPRFFNDSMIAVIADLFFVGSYAFCSINLHLKTFEDLPVTAPGFGRPLPPLTLPVAHAALLEAPDRTRGARPRVWGPRDLQTRHDNLCKRSCS